MSLNFHLSRFAAWFALLAVVLQFAAMPVASTHMLRQALQMEDAQLISICTPRGSEQLLVSADGQPLHKSHLTKASHCPFCLTGGASLLVPANGFEVAFGMSGHEVWLPVSALAPAGAGALWPFSHGPPVA